MAFEAPHYRRSMSKTIYCVRYSTPKGYINEVVDPYVGNEYVYMDDLEYVTIGIVYAFQVAYDSYG